MTRARSKWTKLLNSTNGRLAQNWVQAARLEIDYGEKKKAIELLIKGLRFASHNLEQLYTESRYYAQIYASAEKFDEIEQEIGFMIKFQIRWDYKKSLNFEILIKMEF